MSGKPKPRHVSDATLSPKELFLEGLRKGLSIHGAAKGAGVDRRTAYRWRDADKEFEEAWDDALEAGTDALEDALTRRALTISDKGAMFLLQARRPAKYRQPTRVEHSGPNGGPIPLYDLSKLSDEELAQLEHLTGKAADNRGNQG